MNVASLSSKKYELYFISETEMSARPSCVITFVSAVLFFALLSFFVFASSGMAVTPSQVLVLYNASWEERHPLTGPQQDSLQVAEYYVRMHNNPVNGEKPYMLGLECPALRPAQLKEWRLRERSGDNASGVVYSRSASRKELDAGEMRDGRFVEVALPETGSPWDMRTLSLDLEADSLPSRLALVSEGQTLYPGQVDVQSQGDWHIRAAGSHFVRGSFLARASCSDSTGKIHSWTASYGDFRDVSLSTTGVDGLRDDQTYLDCIENPIKAFLEDPVNARPDGTLLKDHILFFVVCYGLPRTVSTPYGIATGITEHMRDFGTEVDFGQRLQVMYYDLETLRRNNVIPMRFKTKKKAESSAFNDYLFRSELSRPFYEQGINPFLHPDLYRSKKGRTGAEPRRFSSSERMIVPDKHLFFSMRIDGEDALSAMELIDRSVYASNHAGPAMGVLPEFCIDDSEGRTGALGAGTPGQMFWDLGFRHFYQHPRGWTRLELFRLDPACGFFNADAVFLPGGVATFVQSSQGWNMKDSRFLKFLDQGVTVTAGAARVAPGKAPHIHNRSFWDENVFYPYLLRGYCVGEVLLMNQGHLAWITSFVGDPLYRLPKKSSGSVAFAADMSWDKDVTVLSWRDRNLGPGVLVMVDVRSSAAEPRLAQMQLVKDVATVGTSQRYAFERFSSRPYVFVPLEVAQKHGKWRVELLDPYGNRSELIGELGQADKR